MGFPVINPAATGKKINDLRVANGFSVLDLKNYFGFATTNAIYKWLKGDSMPTVDNLLGLSILFGVSMNDLVVYDVSRK